jgi:hypothetical protein
MSICPRCNGTGDSPLCETCICVYCYGTGEVDDDGKPNVPRKIVCKPNEREEDEDETRNVRY